MLREKDFSARCRVCALIATILLSACGGGGGGGSHSGGDKVVCETSDAIVPPDGCGRLLVGFTDLDGDFVRYQVAITSLRVLRANGTGIELLEKDNTVDLVQYKGLAELVTAATLPVDVYVGVEITLDYTDADIRVDVDGAAEKVEVRYPDGRRVRELKLTLDLDPDNRPLARPVPPPLLLLDFSLTASHIVDTRETPPLVEIYPVITAEANPPPPQKFRLRGPLLDVDQRQLSYRIALRPFYLSRGRQGGVEIFVDGNTEWEIDGEVFFSTNGLAALEEQPADTATLAFGHFDTDRHRFTASVVYVGSSVPGEIQEALQGHVLAREGNLLTLIDTRLIRTDGSVLYEDERQLLLPVDTRVIRPGFFTAQRTSAAVSVGQRITALGLWKDAQWLNAAEVRLLPTALDATVNRASEKTLDVTTLAFGNRDSLLFDYAGTGREEADDADPFNYLVDIQSLEPRKWAKYAPLRIFGYVTAYGSAPPDFDAVAVEDFTERGAQLMVTWAGDGSTQALLSLDANGLRPNLAAGILGSDFYIRRGAVFTNLLDLNRAILLQPVLEHGIYAIVAGDLIRLYSDFGAFAVDLDRYIVGGAAVKILHAEGGYRSGAVVMSVNQLEVVLGNID
ncbi:hypothetical protein [Microbulbifer thermotolerans]|uniref:hypothetical protein n=1 Tax=Microbulbifer thermotolerans TaxID=252514 RepID=UPI00224A7265|nr:hypothetical protein [Microbulbifer thermotolerans]MCX2778317.1 hypothetical protein [Microbulbifer thermotolerans]MCX2804356.1 hypothetical protein [Microbulbifer thermotolerans]